jgi:periplasmic protein CpxP/Spy
MQASSPRKDVVMKSLFKPLLIGALLASAGFNVLAQGAGPGPMMPGGPMGHHGPRDPARMHQAMAQRQAELKTSLKLSAEQEAAWATYVAAMQPPSDMPGMNPEYRQKMHEEMQKLTTPERIDQMIAMKARRDAEMAKRADATKAFYATLSPEQQKVFDAGTMRHGPRHARAGRPAQKS